MKEKVSAFVITKNEEEKLDRCLESIQWADEIVIVDSGSTDKTTAIAKKFTKKVYRRTFDNYGQQKQAAIEKCSNAWILEVDADEVVTKQLKDEIQKLCNNAEQMNKYAAYIITRQEYFLKKPLMRSKIPRLYKKDAVKYIGEIHEVLTVNGKRCKIKGMIEHESDRYDTIEKRVEKINVYTEKEAEIRIKQQEWNIPKVLGMMLVVPTAYFVWLYVRKGLFGKGYRGLIWSLLTAYYHFLIYAKIYEHIYKTKNTTIENEEAQNRIS